METNKNTSSNLKINVICYLTKGIFHVKAYLTEKFK